MALPGSGPISIGNIRTELNNAGTSNFSLAKAGQQFNALIGSGYVPLNNASTSKPNTSSPFQISEWFSYDHSSNRSCGLTFFSAATQIDKYYYQRFLITGCGVGCNSPIRITYTNAPPNNLSPRTDYIQLFGSYPFNNVGTLIGTPVISLALGFGQAGTYDYEWTVSSASEVVYVVSWADDPFDVYGSGPYDLRIGCGTPTNTPTQPVTPTPTTTPTPTPTAPSVAISLSDPQSDGCTACRLTTYSTTKYIPPGDTTPTVNDVVYNNSSLSTVFNGASQWWKTSWGGDLYSIQVNASGVVLAITTCSTCPTQTPTPTTTPPNTPSNTPTPAVTTTPPVTPSNTGTPAVTPSQTPTSSPASVNVVKLIECPDYGSRVLSVLYSSAPVDGDVIQVNSGSFTGCFTVSYFKPGTGSDGTLGGYTSILDCINCTI